LQCLFINPFNIILQYYSFVIDYNIWIFYR